MNHGRETERNRFGKRRLAKLLSDGRSALDMYFAFTYCLGYPERWHSAHANQDREIDCILLSVPCLSYVFMFESRCITDP